MRWRFVDWRRQTAYLSVLFGVLASPSHCLSQSQTQRATAKKELSEGNYIEAEAIYRHLLKTTPGDAGLLADLGITLGLEHRSDDAIAAYTTALHLEHNPKTYALLTMEECNLGRYSAARPMLERIAKDGVDQPQLLTLVAPCFLDAGLPVEAVEIYQRLHETSTGPQDIVMVQLARAYVASAQFFFSRLDASPGKGVYVSALQAAREGNATDARGAYTQAATNSVFFIPAATFNASLKQWRAHPEDAALLYQLVVLSGEQSIRSVQEASDLYPKSPYVRQLLAQVTAQQGKRADAIAAYESLVQTNPDLPRLRQELGMLYIDEQDWGNALPVFQAQLAAYPDDPQALARISECLLQLERYEELKAFLVPYAAGQLASLWLRLDLGTALQKLGDVSGSITQLSLAEKQYPSDKTVHYRLMRLYTSSGDREAAAREADLFRAAK